MMNQIPRRKLMERLVKPVLVAGLAGCVCGCSALVDCLIKFSWDHQKWKEGDPSMFYSEAPTEEAQAP